MLEVEPASEAGHGPLHHVLLDRETAYQCTFEALATSRYNASTDRRPLPVILAATGLGKTSFLASFIQCKGEYLYLPEKVRNVAKESLGTRTVVTHRSPGAIVCTSPILSVMMRGIVLFCVLCMAFCDF